MSAVEFGKWNGARKRSGNRTSRGIFQDETGVHLMWLDGSKRGNN